MTLAIYQSLDLAECEQRLQALAATTSPLLLSFQNIGIFPTPQAAIFLGPTVTAPLLALHAQVNDLLRDVGTYPSFDYYLPGQWIPHCALAMELAPGLVTDALEIALHLPLPLRGQIVEIGVVEFRPVKHLFRYDLQRNRMEESASSDANGR
ncbi:MAG: 2'-5' RNA ligase family protein [Chloroflexi bacterium]|nr:2'-5' RNA ligase family protein [Chloroflexota bacterium]MCI0576645.1 2'-5' RNA ligase family protein [Chloroflexota bacterium]MCI0646987.1 2'-5' RNA ligase family protein [Chloroflexota bacterium]MCI0730687.1 2'-5' RNA ligase family protein [Chloroflexota bacterium]